jgi:hypothetical protein
MKYEFTVVGRTPGVTETYSTIGEVHGDTPKQALLAALADTYGDHPKRLASRPDDEQIKNRPAYGSPEERTEVLISSLADEGWIDRGRLTEQYAVLDDRATSWALEGEEHTYDVQVWPFGQKPRRAIQDTATKRLFIGVLSDAGDDHPVVRVMLAGDREEASRGLTDSFADDYGLDDNDELNGVLIVYDTLGAASTGGGVYQPEAWY